MIKTTFFYLFYMVPAAFLSPFISNIIGVPWTSFSFGLGLVLWVKVLKITNLI